MQNTPSATSSDCNSSTQPTPAHMDAQVFSRPKYKIANSNRRKINKSSILDKSR